MKVVNCVENYLRNITTIKIEKTPMRNDLCLFFRSADKYVISIISFPRNV